MRQRVARHDRLDPGGSQRLDERSPSGPQPNTPAVDPGRAFARGRGVQRDAQRLKQRALRVGEVVRERVREPFGPGQARAQGAVRRAVPREAKVGAQVADSRPCRRCSGRTARQGRAPTRSPAPGDGLDRPHELVPEDERPVEGGVADPPFEGTSAGRTRTGRRPSRARRTSPSRGSGAGSSWSLEIARAVEAKRLHGRWP